MQYKDESEEYSLVEILGASALFNQAYEQETGSNPSEHLFLCEGSLNSVNDANGYPLGIYTYKFSHCKIGKDNGVLYAVCYDENEDKVFFEVTENQGFYQLN